jgi:hypothetical protein
MARKKAPITELKFTELQKAILEDNYSYVGTAKSQAAPFQISLHTANQHLEENVHKFLLEQGGDEMHNLIAAKRIQVDEQTMEITIKSENSDKDEKDEKDDVVGEPTGGDSEDATT